LEKLDCENSPVGEELMVTIEPACRLTRRRWARQANPALVAELASPELISGFQHLTGFNST